MNREETKDFILMVADILEIPVPRLSCDTSGFIGKHQNGGTDGKTIFLKKSYPTKMDMFFSVAHEMRHIWQIQNGVVINRTNRENCSVEEYNQQDTEIDANAFAAMVIMNTFPLPLSLTGFPHI